MGQVLGQVGALPDVYSELEVNFFLLRRLLGVRSKEGEKQGKVGGAVWEERAGMGWGGAGAGWGGGGRDADSEGDQVRAGASLFRAADQELRRPENPCAAWIVPGTEWRTAGSLARGPILPCRASERAARALYGSRR